MVRASGPTRPNWRCGAVPGGCGAGSPQELWLQTDLAAHSGMNVIAVWHKPRYSSTGSKQGLHALRDDLYLGGVDLLLTGHHHYYYERFAPMKTGARAAAPPAFDPAYGIRQFIVGTGGKSHHTFSGAALSTSEVRDDETFGVLRLTLHARSYDWRFLPARGGTFTDAGPGAVHGPPPVAAAPPGTGGRRSAEQWLRARGPEGRASSLVSAGAWPHLAWLQQGASVG